MTNHGRPVGPEERQRPAPDVEPAVRADTRQPTAADAFRDVPGVDDPAGHHADGTLDETSDELLARRDADLAAHTADVAARERLEGLHAPGVPALGDEPAPAPDVFRAVVGAPAGPATQDAATLSPQELAETVLGLRDPAPYLGDELQLDKTPAEEGYHCPVCMYLHESEEGEDGEPGELDERLEWSDTRTMIVCTECDREYPAMLCCPDLGDSTTIYVSSVAEVAGAAVDRERDRAALWAGELAEIEHVLAGVVDVGATPDEHVGARLPERVAAIIGAAYDQGREEGVREATAQVSAIVRDGETPGASA